MILKQDWWFRKKTEVEDFILIIFCFLIFSVACCIVTLCIAISIRIDVEKQRKKKTQEQILRIQTKQQKLATEYRPFNDEKTIRYYPKRK